MNVNLSSRMLLVDQVDLRVRRMGRLIIHHSSAQVSLSPTLLVIAGKERTLTIYILFSGYTGHQ